MKLPNIFSKGASASKAPLTTAKKRQYIMASLIFAGVIAVSTIASYAIKHNQDNNQTSVVKPEQIDKVDLSQPNSMLNNEGILKAEYSSKLDAISKQMEEMNKWRENQEIENQQNKATKNLPDFNGAAQLPPAPPTGIKAGQGISADGQGSSVPTSLIKSIDFSQRINTAGTGNSADINTSVVTGVRPNIVVNGDGGNVEYLNMGQNGQSNSTGKFRAQKSYIPSGTFFQAVLLGGIDAPTGGESATASPYPVLMRVTNMAQLPNRFRENFKECFITGTGYGDLSSERAIVRTEQLSCVGSDGRAIDISIKGYVAGEDGKAGIRGRLVTKQGAVLKNALITGLLSGIGQGFSSAAGTVNSTALGTVSSIPDSKQMQAALGSGVGNAFEKLAAYYIKLADKMFPVIEIDAGRRVDVVLMKGFQIDGGDGK